MKGAIVYFSGTGNTEFTAKCFKEEFSKQGIECSLIDVSKKKRINDDYSFIVFGCPIHADIFPEFFTDWIKDNISEGNNRKCIIFSTQAGESAAGAEDLGEMLAKKGFDIAAKVMIRMPQNYYIAGFKKTPDEEAQELKRKAKKAAGSIVQGFLKGEKNTVNISASRLFYGRIAYKLFKKYSNSWAKRNLDADMDVCVKCGKCAKNCPAKNITIGDKVDFKSQCISCQRCIHGCPVNAFRFKGKHIVQYKV